MSVTSFISKRFNSRHNLPRSIVAMRAISATGVALSVASLIVATSIGRGFESAYKKALMDFNAHVVVMGMGEITDPVQVVSGLELLRDKIGIEATTPFIYREALLIGEGAIRGVVVKGIDPASFGRVNPMSVKLLEGQTDISGVFERKNPKEPVKVILGAAFSEMQGSIALKMFIPYESEPAKKKDRFVDVEVAGSFESGVHDYDAQFVLMDDNDLRRLFGIGGKTVTGIELKLADPLDAERAAREIDLELGPSFKGVAWSELNRDLMSAVNLEKLMSLLIMGIMVIVALLNIIAVLVLTMLARQAGVSTLMALGLGGGRVVGLFVRAGMHVVLPGVLIGVVIGVLVATAIGRFNLVPLEAQVYLIGSLPADISYTLCAIFALACVSVGFLTCVIASRRLAALPITEGLKQAR